MAMARDRGPAEQQGDGQPENMNELRDRSGGSALAGKGKDVPPRSASASGRDASRSAGDDSRDSQGDGSALEEDGDEVLDAE